jgi:hypothetical protein
MVESLNIKLKKFKKKLREREEGKRKDMASKKQSSVKKGQSLVPATAKGFKESSQNQ